MGLSVLVGARRVTPDPPPLRHCCFTAPSPAILRLFAKDPASRRRNLYLRTYNVVPLTEDCGIIEWVPQTAGLRHCCTPTYTALHLFHKHTLGQIKQLYDRHDKQQVKKWTAWYNEVSPTAGDGPGSGSRVMLRVPAAGA